MLRPTIANIHKQNLIHNFKKLKSIADPHGFFCPMVKANAYGHGDVEVVRTLSDVGANEFGVALVEEGIKIRKSGLSQVEILVFSPCIDENSVSALAEFSLTPVVSSWEELNLLDRVISRNNFGIHLKFDTGMSRLGFADNEAKRVAGHLRNNPKIKVKGICSHLISGEDFCSPNSRTKIQINRFREVRSAFADFNPICHLYNSGALVSHWSFEGAAAGEFGSRPGISLYGIKPQVECKGDPVESRWRALDLKPVMELKTKVIHLHNISKGETVSYDGTYVAPGPTLIGVLPIGYADGYMRRLSSKSQVLCRGKKVNVTGIICMDYTMINLSELISTEFSSGDHGLLNEEVVIIGTQNGNEVTATELAELAHSNSYEVLTQISSRVPRIYL